MSQMTLSDCRKSGMAKSTLVAEASSSHLAKELSKPVSSTSIAGGSTSACSSRWLADPASRPATPHRVIGAMP